MKFRWPWTKRRQTRETGLAQVRKMKRSVMPGFAYDYGDFEENKRRAAELRRQAQQGDG